MILIQADGGSCTPTITTTTVMSDINWDDCTSNIIDDRNTDSHSKNYVDVEQLAEVPKRKKEKHLFDKKCPERRYSRMHLGCN